MLNVGWGLPRWFSGKEFSRQCVRRKRCRFDLGIAKILWRRKWQPIAVFLPEEFPRQKSLVGYSPRGHKESDMTERQSKQSIQTRTKACWNCSIEEVGSFASENKETENFGEGEGVEEQNPKQNDKMTPITKIIKRLMSEIQHQICLCRCYIRLSLQAQNSVSNAIRVAYQFWILKLKPKVKLSQE